MVEATWPKGRVMHLHQCWTLKMSQGVLKRTVGLCTKDPPSAPKP